MRNFDFKKETKNLYNEKIVSLITQIYEYKGKQLLLIESKPDILTNLIEIAKIQSTVSSNRIEGIFTNSKRVNEMFKKNSEPKNRSEKEIAGYRDVLNTIHESYDVILPRANIILQLHRDLYSYENQSFAGKWKNLDNYIEETDNLGHKRIRFKPLSAFETPDAMDTLCNNFINEFSKSEIDPLILISVFILDFLCIHPFNDGNGRMSRLLTLLLLYKAGFLVGKYISIEKIIENNKEEYYDVLEKSSINWINENNDYFPFLDFFLKMLIKTYKEFDSRVDYLSKKTSKYDRIKAIFDNKLGKITKQEIQEICPDISITTIEATLSGLLKDGFIIKIGDGRYTSYARNIQ